MPSSDTAPARALIALARAGDDGGDGLAASLEAAHPGFETVVTHDADAALRLLDSAEREQRPVALVIVDAALGEEGVARVLEAAEGLGPDTRRALLASPTGWAADGPGAPRVDCRLEVAGEGPGPLAEIADLLAEWERATGVGREPIQLVGFAWGERCHELRDLLVRNRVPYRWTDVEADRDDAARVLAATSYPKGPFPVVVLPDGRALADPTTVDLADALGAATRADDEPYDLVIVGAGPAGLAAAVSSASEGVRTVLVEAEATGGQAGASARIENYPGFPGGIRGASLADRMLVQARRFGAELVIANPACGLRRDGGLLRVELEDGSVVLGRAVLLACGVRYRRLGVQGEERLSGRGVYYASGLAEAAELGDQRVVVVGGGNSAGQAALHLAEHAREVVLATRDPSVAEGMSAYLVEQLEARSSIRIRPGTSVRRLVGRRRLERVVLEGPDGTERLDAAAVYVYAGREPRTEWLPAAVRRDEDGLVLAGADAMLDGGSAMRDEPRTGRRRPTPLPFETSMPGVFVAGDARHGSVGRVAQAVGDGAASIPSIHAWLRRL